MQDQNKIYRAYLSAVAYREKPTAAPPETDGSLEETLAIAIALTQSCGMLCTKQNLLVRVDGFLNQPAAQNPPGVGAPKEAAAGAPPSIAEEEHADDQFHRWQEDGYTAIKDDKPVDTFLTPMALWESSFPDRRSVLFVKNSSDEIFGFDVFTGKCIDDDGLSLDAAGMERLAGARLGNIPDNYPGVTIFPPYNTMATKEAIMNKIASIPRNAAPTPTDSSPSS